MRGDLLMPGGLPANPEMGRSSRPLHKTIDHLFLAGLLEGDGELVAVDLHDMAVAEFLVEHAVVEREFRRGAGRFGDQLALDRQGCALAARETAAVARRKR